MDNKCPRCKHEAHDPNDCQWEYGGNQWNPDAYCWCHGAGIDPVHFSDTTINNLPFAIGGVIIWIVIFYIIYTVIT